MNLPADLESVQGVELVVLVVVAGDAEGDGLRAGGEVGLQAQDLHLGQRVHVDRVLNHSGGV